MVCGSAWAVVEQQAMLSLKPEEIRFWEAVLTAGMHGNYNLHDMAESADYAVELRRERLKQPEQSKLPYWITDA